MNPDEIAFRDLIMRRGFEKIEDFAREIGVSHMTVRRALSQNGSHLRARRRTELALGSAWWTSASDFALLNRLAEKLGIDPVLSTSDAFRKALRRAGVKFERGSEDRASLLSAATAHIKQKPANSP